MDHSPTTTTKDKPQRRCADATSSGRRAHCDDDKHDFQSLEHHRLKARKTGKPIQPRLVTTFFFAQFGVSRAKDIASSCDGMAPAARRMALRNQRMPNSSKRTPMT